MLLGLSKIIECPGAEVSFSTSLDLSDLQFGSGFPIDQPVLATGVVRNTAGVMVLKGSLTTHLHGVCDRCAGEFDRDLQLPLEAMLVTELSDEENEDEWVFQLEGDSADLDDIVTTTLVLNMDAQLLCAPDCRGLCFRCGKNLNEGPCNCQPEMDPRFAALRQLLKDK